MLDISEMLGKGVNWENILKAIWQNPSKIKMWISIDPDIPFLEIYSEDFLTQMHKDTCTRWFTSAACTSDKFETFLCPLGYLLNEVRHSHIM